MRLIGSVPCEGQRRRFVPFTYLRPRFEQLANALSRDVLSDEERQGAVRNSESGPQRASLVVRGGTEAIEVYAIVDSRKPIGIDIDRRELIGDLVAHHREPVDATKDGNQRTRRRADEYLPKLSILAAEARLDEHGSSGKTRSDDGAKCRRRQTMRVHDVGRPGLAGDVKGHGDDLGDLRGVKGEARCRDVAGQRHGDPPNLYSVDRIASRQSIREHCGMDSNLCPGPHECAGEAERLLLSSGDVGKQSLRNHQDAERWIPRIRFAVHGPEIIMTKLVFSGGSMNTPLCLARVLMLLVCISAPFAPCLAQPPIEPSWNGKYLSHYLRELNNPDPIQRQLSCEAIGSMGSTAAAAVPELSKLLESKEQTDRIAAAMALAKIGDAAKAAIPLLQKMEQSADVHEKKVAQIAILALEPPASTVAFEFFSSAYVLSFLIAVLIGGSVAFLFWKRRVPTKPSGQGPAKTSEGTSSASSRAGDASGTASTTGGEPPDTSVGGTTPTTPSSASTYRKRVSRQLPGMETYIKEHEGPESVKRELARAQDEFRRTCDKQQEIAKYYNSEELTKDPERLRQLRLESDELALKHYRLEVRVKGLEVKMLEMLIDQGGASDAALRERTEVTIKQKWDDLRTLCETPAKTLWKGEQWVSVATASHSPIADLRAHLATFDVTIGERSASRTAEGTDPASEGGSSPDEGSTGADDSTKAADAGEAAGAVAGGESAPAQSVSEDQSSEVIGGEPPKPVE